jgi:hypothetical protein
VPDSLLNGDFQIVLGNLGIATSKRFRYGTSLTNVAQAIPVNFTVRNTRTNKDVDFAFRERDTAYGETVNGSRKGILSFSRTGVSDEIIFLAKVDSPWVASWSVKFYLTGSITDSAAKARQVTSGDTLTLKLRNPFLSNDTLQFVTIAASINSELAKTNMDKIRVVPNPYIVANAWEGENTFSNGRGPRELHFINLPPRCTIRIYNIRGQLITTLEHSNPIWNGTEIWNMQTKESLDISYGLYIYHIEALDIGQKVGKFAVIK